MTIEAIKVNAEYTPLDLMLWRRFRREVPGLVEDTFNRNPGLADAGVFLPVGRVVLVQVPAPDAQGTRAAPVVTLYD